MSFFRKLFSGGSKAKKKEYPNIIQDVDPMESWTKVGELGDGAFGKVFKVSPAEQWAQGRGEGLGLLSSLQQLD